MTLTFPFMTTEEEVRDMLADLKKIPAAETSAATKELITLLETDVPQYLAYLADLKQRATA